MLDIGSAGACGRGGKGGITATQLVGVRDSAHSTYLDLSRPSAAEDLRALVYHHRYPPRPRPPEEVLLA